MSTLQTRRLDIGDPLWEEAWVDGLPVVPPTPERVEAMLGGTTRDPAELVAVLPPRKGRATVEKIAINAVLAGCRPEYLPVLIAAVEAVADPAFNLNSIIATTHCCTPLIVVNGPVARRIGVNAGANCFGQGWRANATIGRALRLVMHNIAGAFPATVDMSTFGHPGKYTYCIAENEAVNPWQPLHADRGMPRGSDAVTVFAAEAPHSANDHVSVHGRGLSVTIADTMATLGNNNMYGAGEIMVVLSPEHVRSLVQTGWGKEDFRAFLFERARRPIADLKLGGMFSEEFRRAYWPKWVNVEDDAERVPIVRRPDDILIVVAGGEVGKFSMVIPGWGDFGTRAITKPIQG